MKREDEQETANADSVAMLAQQLAATVARHEANTATEAAIIAKNVETAAISENDTPAVCAAVGSELCLPNTL